MKELYQACAKFTKHVLHAPDQSLRSISILLLALIVSASSVMGQLTIKVTSVPSNTPFGTPIFVGGTFNNWNPADMTKKMTALGNGKYTITIMPAPGQVEFKFTRGSWDQVEGTTAGQPLTLNHKVAYNGQPKTVEFTIASWPDLLTGGNGPNTIIGNGVHTISDEFYIPELNRTRKVWIYLPPDYTTNPNKYYPVMYMQDGQNLFNSMTAVAGEWGVDESLDNLSTTGDPGCIVVGINSGGSHRTDEYSPWVNPSYGGGEGAEYVHFIVETLKPYVDQNYRTLSDREHTGIGGSNMGALISMYAIAEYQDVFSKAAILSPSFWFVGNKMADFIISKGKQNDVRIYLMSGGQEPPAIGQGVELVAEALFEAGFGADEVFISSPTDGQHLEWAWSREFPLAYEWLFELDKAITGTDDFTSTTQVSTLSVFPNPATDWVRINGEALDQKVEVTIMDMAGRVWLNERQNGTDLIETAELPRGVYMLTVLRKNGRPETLRFVHE